jgi:hypothetical protein
MEDKNDQEKITQRLLDYALTPEAVENTSNGPAKSRTSTSL